MPKYTFKALDAASAVGPGPVLKFPSIRSIGKMAGQLFFTGGPFSWIVHIEASLNGTDFSPTGVSIQDDGTPNFPDGHYFWPINDDQFSLVKAIRMNLVSLSGGSSPTITFLLAIEEEE